MQRWTPAACLVLMLAPLATPATVPLVQVGKGPAPVINGKLDDPGWRTCAQLMPFVEAEGSGLAQVQTKALLFYSDAGLHVAFVCDEPKVERLHAHFKERDSALWKDDCVELFVQRAGRKGMDHVIVNSLGATYEARNRAAQWNPAVQAAAFKTKEGWGVELTLPWPDLGGAPKSGQTWRMNFCRERKVETELSCWSCTYGKFLKPERFGEVVFAQSAVRVERLDLAKPAPGANRARVRVAAPGKSVVRLRALGGKPTSTGPGGGGVDLVYPVGLTGTETVLQAEVAGRVVWRTAWPVTIHPRPQLDVLSQAMEDLGAIQAKLPQDNALRQSIQTEVAAGRQAAAALETAITDSLAQGRPLPQKRYVQLNRAVSDQAQALSAMQWPLWTKSNWLDVGRHELPPTVESVGELRFTALVNEYESGNVIISNLASRPLRLRLVASGMDWLTDLPPGQRNVLHNPGLEEGTLRDGTPKGWNGGTGRRGSCQVVETGDRGRALLADRADARKSFTLRQNLKLVPGERYTCQFWAKADGSSPDLRVLVINKGWTWSAGSRAIAGTHGWRQFQFSFTPAKSPSHQLVIYAGAGGRGRVWLDDFLLVEGASATTQFQGAKPRLAVADWQELRGGQTVADPLVPLNPAGRLDVPPGESRQVWITLPARDLPPGRYECSLLARPLATAARQGSAPSKTVALRVHVPPLRITTSPSFAVYNWDYAKTEAEVKNLYEHKVNFFNHGTHMPKPGFDADGTPNGRIDYSRYDTVLRIKMKYARKAGGQILFAYGIIRDFHRTVSSKYGWAFRDPAWDRAFRYTYTRWLDHLKALGLRYEDYCVQVWDEATGPNVDYVVEGGKLLREIDPKVRLVMDGAQSLAEVKRIDPYIDVWVPHLTKLKHAKDRVELLRYYLASGEPVYSYSCSTFMKARPAYAYHRCKPWQAASFGVNGTFYWAYNSWRGDPWNDFDGPIADCGVIYPGEGGPIDSRRWEGTREGIEDWQIMRLLKGLAEGRSQEAQPARELIGRGIEQVLAEPTDVGRAQTFRLEFIEAAQRLAAADTLRITQASETAEGRQFTVTLKTSRPAAGRLLYRVLGTGEWLSVSLPRATDHRAAVALPPVAGAEWIALVWDDLGRVAYQRGPQP